MDGVHLLRCVERRAPIVCRALRVLLEQFPARLELATQLMDLELLLKPGPGAGELQKFLLLIGHWTTEVCTNPE